MQETTTDEVTAQEPAPRRRRRRVVIALMLSLVVVLAVVRWSDSDDSTPPTDGETSAYAPRPDVVAEYNGSKDGFSKAAIANVAGHAGIMVVNKNNHNGRTELSARDVNELATTSSDEVGTDVFGYFITQHWIQRFKKNFQPWSSTFKDEWLLRDAEDELVPYWGVGGQPGTERAPLGYMIDLTNPDYQAWAVRSLTAWLKSAHYSGIALDETNELSGSSIRRVISDGQTSYNDLFCGAAAPVDENGNCEGVAAYNQAQEDLIQKLSTSLHRAGGMLNYNGIAPSDARGPTRNLGILERTDVDSALNEAFCYEVSARNKETSKAHFNPIRDDIEVMREQANAGKSIIQVTNYQNDEKNKRYAGYCGAAFMVGWQPDHSWYVYHQNYLQDLGKSFPFQTELTLKLGDPVEETDLTAPALTRKFDNGWVAVNDGDAATTVTAPFDMVEFRDGEQGDGFAAGDEIEVGERDGRFFLKKDFVDSGFTTKGPGSQESAMQGQRDKTSRPRRETAPAA